MKETFKLNLAVGIIVSVAMLGVFILFFGNMINNWLNSRNTLDEVTDSNVENSMNTPIVDNNVDVDVKSDEALVGSGDSSKDITAGENNDTSDESTNDVNIRKVEGDILAGFESILVDEDFIEEIELVVEELYQVIDIESGIVECVVILEYGLSRYQKYIDTGLFYKLKVGDKIRGKFIAVPKLDYYFLEIIKEV